jgi:hypothetical protein
LDILVFAFKAAARRKHTEIQLLSVRAPTEVVFERFIVRQLPGNSFARSIAADEIDFVSIGVLQSARDGIGQKRDIAASMRYRNFSDRVFDSCDDACAFRKSLGGAGGLLTFRSIDFRLCVAAFGYGERFRRRKSILQRYLE